MFALKHIPGAEANEGSNGPFSYSVAIIEREFYTFHSKDLIEWWHSLCDSRTPLKICPRKDL